MTPLELITWAGAIALAVAMLAIAAAVVWAVIQTIRGKSTRIRSTSQERIMPPTGKLPRGGAS